MNNEHYPHYIGAMQNPFAFKSHYSLGYWITWLILAAIYGVFLIFRVELSVEEAILDAIIFSLAFALIGLTVWNVVKFTNLSKANLFNAIVTHIVASAILLVFWTSFCQSALSYFYPQLSLFYEFGSSRHFYRMAAGLVLYVLLTMNYYLLIYYDEYRVRKEREHEINDHLHAAQIKILQAQINPHFIFNSLNSISSLILTDPGRAHKMVISLADFLRFTVGKSDEQFVSLASELDAIRNFIDIEKIRFGNRLEFNFDIAGGIDSWKVPALILQPLVENAIKYGLHERTRKAIMSLSCQKNDGKLQITIVNEYDSDVVPAKGESIGVNNVMERLKLIYSRNDLFTTEKSGNDFIARLTLPKQ